MRPELDQFESDLAKRRWEEEAAARDKQWELELVATMDAKHKKEDEARAVAQSANGEPSPKPDTLGSAAGNGDPDAN
eukprot:5371317-Heterocapsa_arctica.AAC.1